MPSFVQTQVVKKREGLCQERFFKREADLDKKHSNDKIPAARGKTMYISIAFTFNCWFFFIIGEYNQSIWSIFIQSNKVIYEFLCLNIITLILVSKKKFFINIVKCNDLEHEFLLDLIKNFNLLSKRQNNFKVLSCVNYISNDKTLIFSFLVKSEKFVLSESTLLMIIYPYDRGR